MKNDRFSTNVRVSIFRLDYLETNITIASLSFSLTDLLSLFLCRLLFFGLQLVRCIRFAHVSDIDVFLLGPKVLLQLRARFILFAIELDIFATCKE